MYFSFLITCSAPTLQVVISPPTAVALDADPYNIFELTCIATVPEGVIVQKLFEWRRGPPGSQTVVTDNGDLITISNRNLERPESTSVLTVSGEPVGDYIYTCAVSMEVPGGLEIAESASANVTVEGKFRYLESSLY